MFSRALLHWPVAAATAPWGSLLFLVLLVLASVFCVAPALAKEAVPVAANAAQEARVMGLAAELRCLVCQNQTIADSHADLAVDLRNQIREMLAKGQSDDQIRKYMTDRYGDFVLYKPPFKATTALLWAGPPALLAIALFALFLMLRSRQRASPDAFEPDTDEEQPAAATRPAQRP
jgi:cytochrome c-type biogenesis protein CcmH